MIAGPPYQQNLDRSATRLTCTFAPGGPVGQRMHPTEVASAGGEIRWPGRCANSPGPESVPLQEIRTMPERTRTLATWRDHVRPTVDGCLEWQGRIDPNGYPRLGGRWAHRAVYELEVGPIPAGHDIDHLCSNPPCVNPEHLDPCTRAEHVARTLRRLGKDDRHVSAAYLRTMGLTYAEVAEALGYAGKNSAAAAVDAAIRKGLIDPDEVPRADRLSEQDQDDIRTLRAIGVPVSDIAEWYGIHSSQASRISRGMTSGHREAS